MVKIRNFVQCPSCSNKTEVVTYSQFYSKLRCLECGVNLSFSDSKKFSLAKFFFQALGFLPLYWAILFLVTLITI